MNAAITIVVMSAVTVALRFLPFWVFRGAPPKYISYLGRVLPAAIMGMLVVYCLKDASFTAAPFALPELIAALCVVVTQVWKRNSLLSILLGTAVYMLLIQVVF